MELDELQKQKVAQWIADGLKLSQIQDRINSEFEVTLTYMEVRFLVDDLKLMPKDPEPKKALHTIGQPVPPTAPAAPAAAAKPPLPEEDVLPPEEATPAGLPSNVSVSVDHIARPGSMVSGNVTFSDGQTAQWFLDEMGRLGLSAAQKGYRPSPADVQHFQAALQQELQKMGM
jgi:hypothetical protein